MPLTITKLKGGKYKVVNKKTGKVHSKATTLSNAQKQVRLINMIDAMKKKKK